MLNYVVSGRSDDDVDDGRGYHLVCDYIVEGTFLTYFILTMTSCYR
jgi:hypothetical protein